ncbi:TMV resistance protein N-like [Dorcoceras hygrometricum]|uniref:TMV resistance protein N-like n=1 Tax=Dorcoceras hygrometricum TaxID=472368 RepID=A0A2Z7DAK2_9LAMI|nr:TMV resistance protein N-like [Dorcoceras hygrometricum]
MNCIDRLPAFLFFRFLAGRRDPDPPRFPTCCHCFVSRCIAVVSYQDARASGNTALSSPCWVLLATMRLVVNYHSSWARQRHVELFDASGIRGIQVLQLVVVLTQLAVPQEVGTRYNTVRTLQKPLQRLHLCVQRIELHKKLYQEQKLAAVNSVHKSRMKTKQCEMHNKNRDDNELSALKKHFPVCYHGFSAGRGVDPAGNAPGGG